MTITEKLQEAKARAEVGSTKIRPQAYRIKKEENDAAKILLFGHMGSGKTHFLLGALLEGERLLVRSADFGNNGLVTIKNALRKLGRLELLDNLLALDLASYEDVIDSLDDIKAFVPDIETFNPTVDVFEGFSSFNIDMLDEYILSKAPGASNSGELRHEGFTHTQQDWQGMKRGTVRAARKFIASKPTGKNIHKIMTCLESKPSVNDLTQASERGPLIQGTGRALMGVGFDVVLECFTKDDKYFYRCSGDSDKYSVKNRGFEIKPVEGADPQRIWRILSGHEASNKV
jgi:hypothetical protein